MTLRIAILCNDRLCLPAVNWLIGSGLTVAAGMPAGMHETSILVKQHCKMAGVPFQYFHKEQFLPELQSWLEKFNPDIVLVKTFPWLIPAESLKKPVHGFINFHYAPLPAYRGPAPLFWMIRNQVKEAGVTVHRMDENFDTGPVLLQQSLPLLPDYTYGWLVTQLAYMGLQLCFNLLQGLATCTLQSIPQQNNAAGWYRRPNPADMQVNWEQMSASSIRSLVLACNPWNKGAATCWNNWAFGLTDVSVIENNGDEQTNDPGTILFIDDKNGLVVSCLHNKLLRINIIYCEEGFFPGNKLSSFGIKPGHRLGTYTMPAHSPNKMASALHPST